MNYPKTEADWILWGADQFKIQQQLNAQIETAFQKIKLLGDQFTTAFWDDHLHSPREIDGRSTEERWNKITLGGMQADIKEFSA